jgi:type 1 glutamine amidotransferase
MYCAKRLSLFAVIGVVVSSIISSAAAQQPAMKPLKALLVLGGCCHNYEEQQEILKKGIAERAHVEVTIAYDPDTTNMHLNPVYENPGWADGYEVIIHDECSSMVKDPAVINRILTPHRWGLPAVMLHCAMHSYRSEPYPEVTPWFELTGVQSTGHGPQLPIDIDFVAGASPITKGFENWQTINEELYNNSVGRLLDTASPLARGKQKGTTKAGKSVDGDYVVVWTNNYHGTKVFATTLGHNNATVADPRYLDLVTRGLLWSCGKLDDKHLKPAAGR